MSVAELISIIVSTYNREDALDAVLRSLAHQSDPDFEIIVADDGSGPSTAQLINTWRAKIAHRVEHVWHADQGFRLAEIRNRAIRAARGTYCIFLDGDCLARKDFVAIHRRLAEQGRGGINRLSGLLQLPLGPLRRIRRNAWNGARACNLAVWRVDLERVDGFDADYKGWGREDSDFIVRLLRAGVRRKDGVFA